MSAAERARAFVDEVLIPREVAAERAGGRLPAEEVATIRREALARRLGGGLHAVAHGGQGWSHEEWFLVEEQFGRSTTALSWRVPSAYNVLARGTPEQIERYLKPALRGELHDAYAVTEEHAGSDPSAIATVATRIDGGWRLDGEKWFVTYGDIAAVYIVMALAEGRPTLSLVDRELEGLSVIDDPPFTHSYPHGHPTLRFAGVDGDVAVKRTGVVHKAREGGVALGLDDEEAVRAAQARLGTPVLVERMAPPGAEIIVSVRRDGFVPVLVIGLGGVLAEALDDVAVLPLPVTDTHVEAALCGLRGAAALAGLDTATAARLAVALTQTDFVLIELNPVIVHAHGAVAVDALADEEVVR